MLFEELCILLNFEKGEIIFNNNKTPYLLYNEEEDLLLISDIINIYIFKENDDKHIDNYIMLNNEDNDKNFINNKVSQFLKHGWIYYNDKKNIIIYDNNDNPVKLDLSIKNSIVFNENNKPPYRLVNTKISEEKLIFLSDLENCYIINDNRNIYIKIKTNNITQIYNLLDKNNWKIQVHKICMTTNS